jgi:hypothetical protein
LQWAHENGCPFWASYAYYAASSKRHFNIVKWIKEKRQKVDVKSS